MRKVVLCVLLVFVAGAATAQDQRRSPSTMSVAVTATNVQAMLAAYAGSSRAHITSLDAGKHVIDFWLEQRKPGPGGNESSMHPEVTEIYVIVSGSGTLVSGGKLVDAKAYSPSQLPGIHSPTFHGKFEGGDTRKVGAGDIIVNPPSTVHTWKSIDAEGLVYIVLWVDPEHKQPAGYVDPVLKK